MEKYLFFDLDGTIFPFGLDAPLSAKEALKLAHKNGHKLFLSTGRSPAEMDPRIHEMHFDGGVFCGGAIALVDKKEIYRKAFSIEQLTEIYAMCEKYGWGAIVQTPVGSFATKYTADGFTNFFIESYGRPLVISNLEIVSNCPLRNDVTKISFWTPSKDVEAIRKELKGRYDVVDNTMGIPLESSAEIVLPGLSKAIGMNAILDYFNAPVSSSIAFGDGANDLEIIKAAGVGVAMGNASEELKSVATYITDDILSDGLSNAMKHFGVC